MNKLFGYILCIVLFSLLASTSVFSQSTNLIDESPTTQADDRSVISVESTEVDDTEIETRLLLILSEIAELSEVRVSVSNSVVQLDGVVFSSESSEEAQQLATSLEGVVKVENKIEVSRDVSQRVRSTWGRVSQLARQISVAFPLLLLSLLVFIGCWYCARFIAGQTRLWRKLAPNLFIASVLGSIARLVIIVLGVLLSLYLLDATSVIATVLGAAGIVGLALGFAVRDTVENFISSILLSVRQPFRMNDYVQINDYVGSVARLTGRDTVLISPDGLQIRIPNSVVFKSVIINYTRHKTRRFKLSVPVDESENIGAAKRIAEQALREVGGILVNPAPQVHIESLGETVIVLSVFGWVDQQSHDLMKVKTACAVSVKTAFRNAGVVMPESIHTIKITNPEQSSSIVDQNHRQMAEIASKDSAANETGLVRSNNTEDESTLDTSVEPDDRSVISTQLAEEQEGSQNLLEH